MNRRSGTEGQGETPPAAPVAGQRAVGLAVALVLGMVLAAVLGFLFVSQLLLPQASLTPTAAVDPKSTGVASAPVEMIVYSDFQ